MRLYWIDASQEYWARWPVGHGVGVTAQSEEEAILLANEAFAEFGMGDVDAFEGAAVATIDSIDDLDQGHVRLNMGNCLKRGVWFPLLLSDTWNGSCPSRI